MIFHSPTQLCDSLVRLFLASFFNFRFEDHNIILISNHILNYRHGIQFMVIRLIIIYSSSLEWF